MHCYLASLTSHHEDGTTDWLVFSRLGGGRPENLSLRMPSDLRQPPTRSEPTTAACSKPQSAADETASVGVRHPADVDFEAICKASNLAIEASQTVTLNPQFVHSHLL
jgi:hypothetical protein